MTFLILLKHTGHNHICHIGCLYFILYIKDYIKEILCDPSIIFQLT